jgi:PAS domain-containing protein
VNGTVIYWNLAAERLLGWRRDEVQGQPLPATGKGPLRNRQGKEIGAAVWTSPIRSSNGVARGTLTIAAEESALRDALPAKAELALLQR